MNLNFKIDRSLYLKDPFEFMKNELIGSFLCTNIDGKFTAGMITEAEVYIGAEDKASHAYPNKLTNRTKTMFEEGGVAYVTLVYGMYNQFNVVVGPKGTANALLIRSLEPVAGIEIMKERRHTDNLYNLTTGPGKLCQALGINFRKHNGINLDGDLIWLSPKISSYKYVQCARIGIDYAEEYKDKPWRFYIKDNKFISKKNKDTE